MRFQKEYNRLNEQQRHAVDTIEGPLLVIAGPGTGKTQLLAVRIANILRLTDTPPQNILCLTFTDSAALNMRERLSSLIGQAAYDVAIGTYHSFGSEIITTYPEYFTTTDVERGEDARLERPIDELTKHQLLLAIAEKLPYDHPLKSTRYHVGDLISTISDLKRALFTPKRLRQTAEQNLKDIAGLSPQIQTILAETKTMPSTYAKALPLFTAIHHQLQQSSGQLAALGLQELESALEQASLANKSTPLTAWKNSWLHKTAQNTWSFTDVRKSQKLQALAEVLELYNSALALQNMYDFDDMILRAIEALKSNDELRFNLQEKYLYLLLDEFQDTNAAQFELVRQLTDNPIHEGRPNVMAVGDDDQAIFAFQGAQASNMVDFTRSFTNVAVILLTKNYRSHPDILHSAHNVSSQIQGRISTELLLVDKKISAANHVSQKAQILRTVAKDKAGEYNWVATHIAQLIQQGTPADQIAVLAPRHAQLESLVPFLNSMDIAVAYEKRENILDAPVIVQLTTMAQLIMALADFNDDSAAHLCSIALSHPAWNIPPETLWQINWQVASSDDSESTWLQAALQHELTAIWLRFFMALAAKTTTDGLELMLDQLIGIEPVMVDNQKIVSPLYSYYFDTTKNKDSEQRFFETLTQLTVIRQKLRSYQTGNENELKLIDFIDFCTMYRAANQPLINTHPIIQGESAVQLMTAFKAKGLEFEHVFLLSLHDNIWGTTARSNTNKLSLPPNMLHIRYGGAGQDELLRLFYVSITRAKQGLYLSSHDFDDNGKKITPLKFLQKSSSDSQPFDATNEPESILPVAYTSTSHAAPLTTADHKTAVQLLWHAPHTNITAPLVSNLQNQLKRYAISPTHVNTFIDLTYGGPDIFLLYILLRFPRAPGIDGQFGNAIHETLEWFSKNGQPNSAKVLSYFDTRLKKHLKDDPRYALLLVRGHKTLSAYLSQHGKEFSLSDICEHNFRREGVMIGEAHLNGKIDRLVIDKNAKTITVIDYKTGEAETTWARNVKLLKYRQQLYAYKLLVEGSHSFKGYTVTKGILAFVEPDSDGRCHNLELTFDTTELDQTRRLIQAIWQRIQQLDFPDTSAYDPTYSGISALIRDLIKD